MTMLTDVQFAKKVVRWMALGVIPSAENARAGRDAIDMAQDELEIEVSDVRQARVVLSAIEQGVVPRLSLCEDAEVQINALISRLRETSSETLRERFERARG